MGLNKGDIHHEPRHGLYNVPVFLPLEQMDAVQQRLDVLADQIQNLPSREHEDANWLKPEVFAGNDDDVCQA